MLVTKEIKIIKNLEIHYKFVPQNDKYNGYVKDYNWELPSILLKEYVEYIEGKKLPKNTKHKVVICHNKTMLWCPIFQHFYINARNPLGLLLTLTVRLYKKRYNISFKYKGKEYETTQYKEIVLI